MEAKTTKLNLFIFQFLVSSTKFHQRNIIKMDEKISQKV